MAFDLLPDTMAADERLLLASLPAKCMCCPNDATLGAQLVRFVEEAVDGRNMEHCIHWALNLVYNMRTSGQEKSMARLLFAGGALPPAVWLSQQQVVVTPAMAGNIRIPNPPESPEQLLDAPQDQMLATTARGVGLELVSLFLRHAGAEFPADMRQAACLSALEAMHTGTIHLERFFAVQVLDLVIFTAPDKEAAVLLPRMIELGLFDALLNYIRGTASAAGFCGVLQVILNMMQSSSVLRESKALGASSSCCSECGAPSDPPWSMEAWLPTLADKGVREAVSEALGNASKLKPYTYAHFSWAYTKTESVEPVAELVLGEIQEGLDFMGYVPGTAIGGSSSGGSSKCDSCPTGTAAASTGSAGGAAGDSDPNAAAGSSKKKKKKKKKAAKQNTGADQQQLPGQPPVAITDDAIRTPLAVVTEAAPDTNGSSQPQQVLGASSSEGKLQPTQASAEAPAGEVHAAAATVDVQQQQQQQASQEEADRQLQQQGGEPRLVLRTKDGKLVRPKQLRNMMHQMQGLGLG